MSRALCNRKNGNGKDEITAYSDPRSLATGYVRNGFGEVIQRASPDSGTTVYQVNALGKPSVNTLSGSVTKIEGLWTNWSIRTAKTTAWR